MMRFMMWIVTVLVALFPAVAMAQEMGAPASGGFGVKAALAVTSGLCIAIASFGGALGQSRVAMAAVEGISRNPEAASKVMTFMIIALALIESLVIYALVIAFLLQGKI